MPRLCELDPLTGAVIRASKTTAVRYERARPGELVHMDVKKIGRIPDGGGWRAHGRQMGSTGARNGATVGFDYVHSLVDDHSRLAYSEIHHDEKADTCAAFFARAVDYFAAHGIDRIERVMTDNAWSYRHGKPSPPSSPTSAPATSSSSRTAPGRTARSNASTAPCRPSGPTGRSSPPTTNAPPPWHHGSTTTTTDDATAPSEASHPSADCHQPDGRVHLGQRSTCEGSAVTGLLLAAGRSPSAGAAGGRSGGRQQQPMEGVSSASEQFVQVLVVLVEEPVGIRRRRGEPRRPPHLARVVAARPRSGRRCSVTAAGRGRPDPRRCGAPRCAGCCP